MSTQRSIEEGVVVLDGKHYPIEGAVTRFKASGEPQRLIFGKAGREDNPFRSGIGWDAARGGIGKERFDGDTSRVWWSTWTLTHDGHLVLPDRFIKTAASGESGLFDVTFINELDNRIFAGFSATVYAYNNTTDSWDSSIDTLPNLPTDSINVRLKGTVYLVIATGTGYTITTDGVTFTDYTDDMLYLVHMDDRLWGIDNTGQLRWTDDLSIDPPIWIDDAQLPLQDGFVSGLIVGRDSEGNELLYALTHQGVYALDEFNRRFIETEAKFPFHPHHGIGADKFRSGLYIPAGMSVYEYIVGPTSTVRSMGPDRDDSLPKDKRGVITDLLGGHYALYALVDAAFELETLEAELVDGNAFATHHSGVLPTGAGFSHILGWDEQGWSVVWLSEAATSRITLATINGAYAKYRLWWGHAGRVYFINLPLSTALPTESSDHEYANGTHQHQFPWVDDGRSDEDKLALRVKVDVRGTSDDETVIVATALNYDDSAYTTLGTITEDGVTTYELPSATDRSGTPFRAHRIRLQGTRGSTTTNTPDVLRVEFEYLRLEDVKYGFQFTVNCASEYEGGGTPEQMREQLYANLKANTLLEMTYRNRGTNDAGDSTPYNFYVKIHDLPSQEFTGEDWHGKIQVTAIEV